MVYGQKNPFIKINRNFHDLYDLVLYKPLFNRFIVTTILIAHFVISPLQSQSEYFSSDWESLEKYCCPDWFRDAKFGIFICWNAYTVPAAGDWYARHMYVEGHRQYKFHLERYGHPSTFGYKDIVGLWKGDKFDPDKLVALFKKAGAKYIVPMAMHHDNFDLWNSKHHEWNSVMYGPKKDIIGLWRQATMKHGLRFGVTTHLARAWCWLQTSHGADTEGSFAGVPYDGRDPQYRYIYFETHGNTSRTYPVRSAEYWPKEWLARITDLVDQHKPDLLYFDGGVPFGEIGRKMIAYFYNKNIQKHGGKLEAVINIKNNSHRLFHGDFRYGIAVEDLERGQLHDISGLPWQTDDSIGDWFWTTGDDYHTPKYVIHQLIDIVSKNGNLLLNVPPREDGILDDQAVALLKEIGAWLNINGEGIYGTRPFIHFGEGPTLVEGGHFKKMPELTAQDFRFTTKGNVVYAFTGGIPSGEVKIESFSQTAYHKIQSVELLGVSQELSFTQEEKWLVVKLPAVLPCKYSIGLKITPLI